MVMNRFLNVKGLACPLPPPPGAGPACSDSRRTHCRLGCHCCGRLPARAGRPLVEQTEPARASLALAWDRHRRDASSSWRRMPHARAEKAED
jgi:hypothetical protein